jgi:hypothetical protein
MIRTISTLALSLPLVLAPAAAPGQELPTAVEIAELRARLLEAADLFVRNWRYHWEVSDRYRTAAGYARGTAPASTPPYLMIRPVSSQTWSPPPGMQRVNLSPRDSAAVADTWRNTLTPSPVSRNTLLHCHPDGASTSTYSRVAAYIIESRSGKRAICPSWFPIGFSPPWDERRNLDHAIVEPLLPQIRLMRRELIQQLRIGLQVVPGDGWIAGQLVRFSLDQEDTTTALRAVSGCGADPWWCSALRGYLLHVRGFVPEADSVFTAMLGEMPQDVHCEWTDFSLLLPEEERKQYRSFPCAARDTVNAAFWWLSDPAYGDGHNERRAEHYARRVRLALLTGTRYNERWDLRLNEGGDAVREMLLRYGWPSFSWWSGRGGDAGHYGYLGITDSLTREHGRFTTAEYTFPRYRMVPSIQAILSPFLSREHHWATTHAAQRYIDPADTLWWPTEHYDRTDGSVVQLFSQQGLFRRDSSALFAMATHLPELDFDTPAGDTLRGWLHRGTSPQDMLREPKALVVGATSTVRAYVGTEPQLLSLELHETNTRGTLARSRFGIRPPRPLAEMRAGEIDISAPVFIRPTAAGESTPRNTEVALARMYASATFRNRSEIGIYWETYGVSERDSVDLTIEVERHENPPGFIRRIGIAMGIARPPRGASTIAWKESQTHSYMRIVSGEVPIQGRVITLNVQALRPGDYTMIVTATRRGGPTASARKEFWIVQ